MGDVAHELAPGVVVGLDIVRHLVEGAGQVGHFPFAFHAFHTHGQVAAAKALGSIRHLLQRSVSLRINSLVRMLAHSSITQADSRKLDQNCCLNSVSCLPEEHKKIQPLCCRARRTSH